MVMITFIILKDEKISRAFSFGDDSGLRLK